MMLSLQPECDRVLIFGCRLDCWFSTEHVCLHIAVATVASLVDLRVVQDNPEFRHLRMLRLLEHVVLGVKTSLKGVGLLIKELCPRDSIGCVLLDDKVEVLRVVHVVLSALVEVFPNNLESHAFLF
jgi:hypothetical protein